LKTTPVLKNEIRPFARQILPVINELGPSTKPFAESLPKLTVSFSVLNEFFNELAYNPGASKAGFLFFLDWGNHNLNSVVSSSDAHGPLGRTVLYFNCELLKLLKGVSEVNPNVNLLVQLLRPPTKQECINEGLLTPQGQPISSSLKGKSPAAAGSGPLSNPFASAASMKSKSGGVG
jgi:phospholipid/cholesterol/gamma-HCH transport system substrate-binding protein